MSENQGHLLIIDDEPDILKALRRQFRRDYNVHIAQSAEEGYEIMKNNPIQVIISDQRMPGMKGSKFFEQVKLDFPDATRLLLTGYADIQDVIAAINDGNIFRYITKPWNPVELETIVREAFTRYNLIVQNKQLLNELQEANTSLEERVNQRTAELAEANQHLQELNNQKNAFMGMAVHDLRGPIGAIRGCAEVLLTNQNLPDDDYVDLVMLIRNTSDKILTLVNDLLDINAIESGKLDLQPDVVHLPTFIKSISSMNRHIGEQKGIHLEVNWQTEEAVAVFDPRRIEQVLDNLLGNAFKFSNAGTTVTITVEAQAPMLTFHVSDQGQGIRADEMDRLFKAFERTSTQPTADEDTTGLGLSICKRIVELHEGRISATSTYGEGSTFSVSLPMALQKGEPTDLEHANI